MIRKFTQLFVSVILFFFAALPALTVSASATHETKPVVEFSDGFADTSLEIKFTPNADVIGAGKTLSGNRTKIKQITDIIGANNLESSDKLFELNDQKKKNDQKKAKLTTGRSLPTLDTYTKIQLKNAVDMEQVISELEALDFIESAFPTMLPTPSPSVTPDFGDLQTHLRASTGTNADFAHQIDGGLGKNVRIVDLEYSWNIDHEELDSVDSSDVITVGEYENPFNDDYHGTAVASLLVGSHDESGIDGIAPQADLKLVNTYSNDYGFDVARSIYTALDYMSAGDIMLIEHQANGPLPGSYDYVPIEYIPSVFDAISYATSLGIIVIEPAGNGSQDLDNTSVFGDMFQKTVRDSGAIIVGASDGCNTTNPDARYHQSSYGSRVDLFADGRCVEAAGYGYLHSGSSEDTYYTNSFSGTSSASAIVAGNAALLSSAAQETGTVLTPAQVLQALTGTGLAQNPVTNGNIGKKPQLREALFVNTDVHLTSCYSGGYGQQLFLHVAKNYYQIPTLPDAQKHASLIVGNAYSSQTGTQPVSFSQDGTNCHTSSYNEVDMTLLEHTARFTELPLDDAQAYSGVLLGYLIIFWGLAG